jgi:hypothetical protein
LVLPHVQDGQALSNAPSPFRYGGHPVIIVSTVFDMIGIKVPFHGLVYFLAAMGYLYFVVYAASRQEVVREKQSTS